MRRGKEPIIAWNDYQLPDIRLPETAIQANSQLHHVQAGDMLDHLAFKYYGDESMWYIIADVNELMDVMVPLTPGMSLVIPSI